MRKVHPTWIIKFQEMWPRVRHKYGRNNNNNNNNKFCLRTAKFKFKNLRMGQMAYLRNSEKYGTDGLAGRLFNLTIGSDL
jgi:hypothetical protein